MKYDERLEVLFAAGDKGLLVFDTAKGKLLKHLKTIENVTALDINKNILAISTQTDN